MILQKNIVPSDDPKIPLADLEKRKSITEYILGFTEWQWHFDKYRFKGQGTYQKDFEKFDEIVCGILLASEGMEKQALGTMLGLKGKIGLHAVEKMVAPLEGKMIHPSSDYWALTADGRRYAAQGAKFETFERDFEISVDRQFPDQSDAQKMAKRLGSKQLAKTQKLETVVKMESAKVFELAATQAPLNHQPDKGTFLKSFQVLSQELVSYPIQIGILGRIREEETYFVAYNRKGEQLAEITNYLNHSDRSALQLDILEKFASEQEEELVDSIPDPKQVAEEEELIALSKSLEAIPEPERNGVLEEAGERRKSFSTLAFENEIGRLFKEAKELWLISPWLRIQPFKKRKTAIQNALAGGMRLYFAYSKSLGTGKEGADQLILKEIGELEKKYPRQVFLIEMPQFHEKIIFARMKDSRRYEYTGSFNVLSFYAKDRHRISRENMRRLAWGVDSETNYQYYMGHLGRRLISEYRSALALFQNARITRKSELMTRFQSLEEQRGRTEIVVRELSETMRKEWAGDCEEAKHILSRKQVLWVNSQLKEQLTSLGQKETLTSIEQQNQRKQLENVLEAFPLGKEQFGDSILKIEILLEELAKKEAERKIKQETEKKAKQEAEQKAKEEARRRSEENAIPKRKKTNKKISQPKKL